MITSIEKMDVGQMNTYSFEGGLKIHVYNTGDVMCDQTIILEKAGKAVAVELPCFKDSIEAVTGWLASRGIELEAKFVSYHAAGGTFLPGVRNIMTSSAVAYNSEGQGKALVDGFIKVFGPGFDGTTVKADAVVGAGEIEIAGIRMVIVPNAEAFEVEIPEAKAVYMHMLGHDCHSIVAGPAHADAIIANIRQYLDRGFELFLTSHYVPEGRQDAEEKIAYLENLKTIVAGSSSGAEFRQKVVEAYPGYSGENYLDMSVGMFFPQ